MKKKEVPKPIWRWIASMGGLLGVLIGGAVFIMLPAPFEMPVWIVCLVIPLVICYITDFKNRELFDQWGITEKRKEKKTE